MKAALPSVSVLLAAVLGCGSAHATTVTAEGAAATAADTQADTPTRHEGVLAAGDTVRIPLPVGPRHLQGSLTLADEQAPAQGYRLWLEAPGWHRELAGQEGTPLQLRFGALLPDAPATLVLQSRTARGAWQITLRREAIAGWQQPGPQAAPDIVHSPTLQRLQQAIAAAPAQAEALQAQFWQQLRQQGGTPLVEPIGQGYSRLTFLWRGARHNVRLLGGPANDHLWLARLPGTDIWQRSFVVPDTLRLGYQLAPDVPRLLPDPDPQQDRIRQRRAVRAVNQSDPNNPGPVMGADSVVALPAAPAQLGVSADARAQGRMQVQVLDSRLLGNRRRIWIYQTPAEPGAAVTDTTHDAPAADDGTPAPSVRKKAQAPRPAAAERARKPSQPRKPLQLYLFDGADYSTKVDGPAILDAVARRLQRPITAIFIDNPSREARSTELPPNPRLADMMATELQPLVQRLTGLPRDPAHTIVGGSSYGGLASAWVALRHPEVFGNVLSMSGSYWWTADEGPLAEGLPAWLARHPRPGLRWFISAGLYETGRNGERNIFETSHELHDILRRQKQTVFFHEYAGGHDYAVWQGAIGDGLLALFGPR